MQIEARNISFRYGEKMPWILKNVSMSVEEKERVGLLGPSGRGKSTLIKLIAGYLKPAEGEILLDGKLLPSRNKSCAADLPAPGKGNQSAMENEESTSGIGYVQRRSHGDSGNREGLAGKISKGTFRWRAAAFLCGTFSV